LTDCRHSKARPNGSLAVRFRPLVPAQSGSTIPLPAIISNQFGSTTDTAIFTSSPTFQPGLIRLNEKPNSLANQISNPGLL